MLLLATRNRDLLIVLQDDNVERIREQDPIEIQWDTLPFKEDVIPNVIGIVYANAEDSTRIVELMQAGDARAAFKFATRGFKYRKEMGDHDHGPTSLVKADA